MNVKLKEVAGYCSMIIEVPDEYQIQCTDPRIFWEDLYRTFPDIIQNDILNCEYFGVEGCPETLEFIRTIVINWLGIYQSPSTFISKFPNYSIGFVFSVIDHQKDSMNFTSDFHSLLKILQTISINNVKNLN